MEKRVFSLHPLQSCHKSEPNTRKKPWRMFQGKHVNTNPPLFISTPVTASHFLPSNTLIWEMLIHLLILEPKGIHCTLKIKYVWLGSEAKVWVWLAVCLFNISKVNKRH